MSQFSTAFTTLTAKGASPGAVPNLLRETVMSLADTVTPRPDAGWRAAFDPLLVRCACNDWKSHELGKPSGAAIDLLIAATPSLLAGECQ